MEIVALNILTVIIPGSIVFAIPETSKTEITFITMGHIPILTIMLTLVKTYDRQNFMVTIQRITLPAITGMSRDINNHITIPDLHRVQLLTHLRH